VYIIPIAVVLGLIGASSLSDGGADAGTFGGVLVLPVLLTIVVRQRYAFLMTDRYPPFSLA
jgi:hypothetical protein